jgi:hypothetical protein
VNRELPPGSSLPAPPGGATVGAWGVTLPPGMEVLPPRLVMLLLLHMSWNRAQEYARLLQTQRDSGGGRPGGGLTGFRTGRAADGTIYATGTEIHALTVLEGQERDRCARLAQQCHDLGITGPDDLPW